MVLSFCQYHKGAILHYLGMITTSSFTVNLLAIPAVAIGAFIGIKVLPLIPQQMFKWIILALGSLGAMKLIVPTLHVWHIVVIAICFIAGLALFTKKNFTATS